MFDNVDDQLGRESETPPVDSGQAAELSGRWRSLCSEFLPHHENGGLWRHHRGWTPTDPHQGWKIHVSATILTACEVLQAVGNYLTRTGAEFKAVASLEVLENLNAGIFHSYSQIGKCITVYPANDDQFREIVEKLHELIPPNIAAPAVPFDIRYKSSNIYYRYGSFISRLGSEMTIRRPDGELLPDRRDTPCPDWLTPPFETDTYINVSPTTSPFASRYKVESAITQRGKGGVYAAVANFPDGERKVVIKEGRRHGETACDGRDGFSRVENEAETLRDLRAAGVDVPIIYDSFADGSNFYLTLERIDGETVHRAAAARKRQPSPSDTLYICKQIAKILADIHAAGWVWRDCKPANFILTPENTVRPIDFEGAHRVDQPDPYVWSSPNFSAPEIFQPGYQTDARFPFAEDLYSLGSTLFFLNTGEVFNNIRDKQANADPCSTNTSQCAAYNEQCALNNGQRAADIVHCATDNDECATNNGQCASNNEQCAADNAQCAADNGQCAADNGQCAADNGQCAADNAQYATNNGQCAADSGTCSANGRRRTFRETPLGSIIYRLLSDYPAERPVAGEVYEQICLIESHLDEQVGEAGIGSDIIEEGFDLQG